MTVSLGVSIAAPSAVIDGTTVDGDTLAMNDLTASAAELNILDGATLSTAELNILDGVTATTAELNQNDNKIAGFAFSIAAGSTNIANVTITPKDAAGTTIVTNSPFWVYLSDSSAGLGLTTHTASGTVTAKSSEGAVLGTGLAKFSILCQGKVTAGTFILEITDSGKNTFYVCAVSPATGAVSISAQLSSGSYG